MQLKQGKFVDFYPLSKGYFCEESKSGNINSIFSTLKSALGIIQIITKHVILLYRTLHQSLT